MKLPNLVWHAAHKHMRDSPLLSQFTFIWGDEQFTLAKKDGGFRSWHAKGIQTVKDICKYTERVLPTFGQLCEWEGTWEGNT